MQTNKIQTSRHLVCLRLCLRVCVCLCVSVCVNVYLCVSVCLCVSMCVYVSMCLRVYVSMCQCKCLYPSFPYAFPHEGLREKVLVGAPTCAIPRPKCSRLRIDSGVEIDGAVCLRGHLIFQCVSGIPPNTSRFLYVSLLRGHWPPCHRLCSLVC